jgi:PAS domain S-box-containing protein
MTPIGRLGVFAMLVLAVAAIAAVAAWQRETTASDWVTHTLVVQSRLDRLVALASERRGPDGRPAIRAELDALAALVDDNPTQRQRVRSLRSALDAPETSRDSTPLIAAMRATESDLLQARTSAARIARTWGVLSTVALAVLSVTLMAVLWAATTRDRRRVLASEARLASLADNVDQLIWMADASGTPEWCNRRWVDYTGLSADALLTNHWTAVRHPEFAALVEARYQAAIAEGVAWEDTFPLRAADGSYRWFLSRARPIRDASGAIIRWFGTSTDVTEQRTVLEELAARERQLALALQAGQMGIWEWNPATNVAVWNAREFELLGVEPASDGRVDAQVFFSRILDEDRDTVLRALAGARERDEDFAIEFRVHRRGGIGWLAGRGRTTGATVLGLNWDITARKDAEEALRAANERLRQLTAELEARVAARTEALSDANTALQAFAHSVAHDLRAPLRNMHGFATAILEDEGDRLSDQGRVYAQRMTQSASRLDTLIQDLLNFSRLSRAELVPGPVSLKNVVERAVSDLQPEIVARRASVQVVTPLPDVQAHAPTLGQVLLNLLGNALKFVADGKAPVIRIYAERIEGRVRLTVEDNGIGIPPAHRARIFQVFERLHGHEQYPGTGIGLAIVKKGVERMRGEVTVDSAPGGGTRFVVDLPAVMPAVAHA